MRTHPTLRSPRPIGRTAKAATQGQSSQTRFCLSAKYCYIVKESYLSPTSSQMCPVLIPPPNARSSNRSPVVNTSGAGSSPKRTIGTVGCKSNAFFTILRTSRTNALALFAITSGEVRTRSEIVTIPAGQDDCYEDMHDCSSLLTNLS